MLKAFLLISGIVLFLGSLYFGYTLIKKEQLASSLDTQKTGHGFISGPPLCKWKVNLPERVMKEDSSQALLIKLENTADEECVTTLSLRAPGFEMSPVKDEQEITLAPKSKGSLSWIVSPREPGTYEIALTDLLDTTILGVIVINTFGLTAMQAKILSILGAIFGPMLTFPWWLEKLWNRHKKKQEALKTPEVK